MFCIFLIYIVNYFDILMFMFIENLKKSFFLLYKIFKIKFGFCCCSYCYWSKFFIFEFMGFNISLGD